MNREQKTAMVEDLHGRFGSSPFVVLADFKGSTVPQMDYVRRTSEKAGVYFRVVKNTLAVRALEGTGKEKLGDHFKGNVGVIVSCEAPRSPVIDGRATLAIVVSSTCMIVASMIDSVISPRCFTSTAGAETAGPG